MLIAISFVVSITLWLVFKLSGTYQTTIEYPCKITNIPNEVRIKDPFIGMITLKVEGQGNTLTSEWFKWKKDTLGIKYNRAFRAGYVLPRDYISAFQYFPTNLRILKVMEDTLYLQIQSLKFKKVPVVSQVEVQLLPDFKLFSKPIISPDSVSVYGNEGELAKIQSWKTQIAHIKQQIGKNYWDIEMEKNAKFTILPEKVRFDISPERYTEVNLFIPIVISDIPSNIAVKLEDSMLRPTCIIPLSLFEKYTQQNWEYPLPYRLLDNELPLIPNYDFLPSDVIVTSPIREIKYSLRQKNQ